MTDLLLFVAGAMPLAWALAVFLSQVKAENDRALMAIRQETLHRGCLSAEGKAEMAAAWLKTKRLKRIGLPERAGEGGSR